MTRTICENCLWGDQCPDKCGCDNYAPLENDNELENTLLQDRQRYEYEWQSYMLTWRGNDKWGDVHDE